MLGWTRGIIFIVMQWGSWPKPTIYLKTCVTQQLSCFIYIWLKNARQQAEGGYQVCNEFEKLGKKPQPFLNQLSKASQCYAASAGGTYGARAQYRIAWNALVQHPDIWVTGYEHSVPNCESRKFRDNDKSCVYEIYSEQSPPCQEEKSRQPILEKRRLVLYDRLLSLTVDGLTWAGFVFYLFLTDFVLCPSCRCPRTLAID